MDSRNNHPVPVTALIDLARQAKALDDPFVQWALIALAVTNDPGLANALKMKLGLRAVVEMLDPFPFDTPAEEEFV
jgi:hypothetical protein